MTSESKARLIQTIMADSDMTYGGEAWTLNKELTGNIEAFEMQCIRSFPIPITLDCNCIQHGSARPYVAVKEATPSGNLNTLVT